MILLGVFLTLFVSIAHADLNLTATNVTISGGPYDVLIKNNTEARYNFTIVSGTNISLINITVNGNYSLQNKSTNMTSDGNYTFRSNSSSGGYTSLFWRNTTATANNGSLVFSMSLLSQTPTVADINRIPWDINITYVNGSIASTTVYTIIDSQAPRVYVVNVTDGNTTGWNSTSNSSEFGKYSYNYSALGLVSPPEFSSAGLLIGPMLRKSYNHSVNVEIEDSNFNTAQVYYLCNLTTPLAIGSNGYYGNQTLSQLSDGSSIDVYNGSVNTQCWTAGDSDGDGIVKFKFAAYDLAGNALYQNNTRPFNGVSLANRSYEYTIDDSLPNITNINITDSRGNTVSLVGNNISTSTYGYLYGGANLTLIIESQGALNSTVGAAASLANYTNATRYGTKPNATTLYFIMNTTTQTVDIFSGTNITAYNITSAMGDGKAIYQATITPSQANTTNGTYMNFAALANVSGPLWATAIYNGLVIIDSDNPSATASVSQGTARPGNSISTSCTGADETSGVSSCQITLTQPNGDQVAETGCGSHTFEGEQTQAIGEYTVTCRITDNVGSSTTSEGARFTVLTGGSGNQTGGGGGGGGRSTTPNYDIDFSKEESKTLQARKSQIKTFTLEGTQKHKIVFEDITDTTVTLRIESEPTRTTLTVGQTDYIDVNGDGTFDVKVTLNSVAEDFANITLTKYENNIEEPTIDQEEPVILPDEPTAQPTQPDTPPIKDEGLTQKTFITWLVSAGLIVLVIVGFIVLRKRQKA